MIKNYCLKIFKDNYLIQLLVNMIKNMNNSI